VSDINNLTVDFVVGGPSLEQINIDAVRATVYYTI